MSTFVQVLQACWQVTGQMAPYLLFGFLVAGILSVLISSEWIEKHLGSGGIGPIIKSSLFGVPLPLCSCSVIPVTASILRSGASQPAAMAFLLSTPQTGVDSMFATYALLGPVFAVFRPVMALVTGIAGGVLVLMFGQKDVPQENSEENKTGQSCCCHAPQKQNKFGESMKYAFITLPRDIAKPLFVGIVIAGLISAFIEKDMLSAYLGGGIGSIVLLMLVGIPIYVCSTASIPIALGFMHMGASPGAALAFLLAGPATNAATIAVVWKMMGRRNAFFYFLTVAVGAVVAGVLLDALFAFPVLEAFGRQHLTMDHGTGWFPQVTAVILILVLITSLTKKKT